MSDFLVFVPAVIFAALWWIKCAELRQANARYATALRGWKDTMDNWHGTLADFQAFVEKAKTWIPRSGTEEGASADQHQIH